MNPFEEFQNFFKKHSTFNIFNHNSNGDKSPLLSFLNKEKFIEIKDKLKNNKLLYSSLGLSTLALGLSFYSMVNQEEQPIKPNVINNILIDKELESLFFKNLEASIPHYTFKTDYSPLTFEYINGIPKYLLKENFNEDLSEINWDFKSPAKPFEKYFSNEYEDILPDNDFLNKVEDFYGLPSNLLFYMASKESWFSLEGKSEANAYGFLGFQIPTATEFSLVKKNEKGEIIENHVHNGFASTDTAARYLLWLNGYINGKNADIFDQTLDENGYSNLDYALAGYNAGPHKVRIKTKNGIKKRIPNYKETKEYIRDIKRLLNGESYLVQKNDSIYSIAKKFKTSVPNIIRNNFNLIDNNDLLAGSVLHIANNQSEEVIVEVEKGFSMSKIAKNTGIPMSDLLEYNDMKKDDILHIGKKIKIPALTTLNKRYSNKI